MTISALAPSYLEPALLAATEAAAGGLPASSATGWVVEPGHEAQGVGLGPGARAVSLGLGGVGRLILCVHGNLAQTIQGQTGGDAPSRAPDLVAALTPALRAAAGALVAAFGGETSAPAEVPGASAFQTRAGEQLLVTTLLDGGVPAAVLALACPVPEPGPDSSPGTAAHDFTALGDAAGVVRAGLDGLRGPIDLLADVEMGVTAELGRARMLVRDILELSPGSVIELDRAAGSPIDVLVNGTLIARGEVVVIDEEFGIRITEVLGYDASRG